MGRPAAAVAASLAVSRLRVRGTQWLYYSCYGHISAALMMCCNVLPHQRCRWLGPRDCIFISLADTACAGPYNACSFIQLPVSHHLQRFKVTEGGPFLSHVIRLLTKPCRHCSAVALPADASCKRKDGAEGIKLHEKTADISHTATIGTGALWAQQQPAPAPLAVPLVVRISLHS